MFQPFGTYGTSEGRAHFPLVLAHCWEGGVVDGISSDCAIPLVLLTGLDVHSNPILEQMPGYAVLSGSPFTRACSWMGLARYKLLLVQVWRGMRVGWW